MLQTIFSRQRHFNCRCQNVHWPNFQATIYLLYSLTPSYLFSLNSNKLFIITLTDKLCVRTKRTITLHVSQFALQVQCNNNNNCITTIKYINAYDNQTIVGTYNSIISSIFRFRVYQKRFGFTAISSSRWLIDFETPVAFYLFFRIFGRRKQTERSMTMVECSILIIIYIIIG